MHPFGLIYMGRMKGLMSRRAGGRGALPLSPQKSSIKESGTTVQLR
ncbi:hypothetical protein KNP414_03326 [Paenibacillus mucilaginosus KNP414]|uniref:Uncharacterized protein n=1 Tax=Paenibacillus mucilaginosus (strain KNP414) TaxID=1036673 RepID=F8F5Z6_PAEMK|nr:hypothetical protein KNP414_03326 [Paenibacillus mucilaginosus KNP414]